MPLGYVLAVLVRIKGSASPTSTDQIFLHVTVGLCVPETFPSSSHSKPYTLCKLLRKRLTPHVFPGLVLQRCPWYPNDPF
jgi:hypothetical protein